MSKPIAWVAAAVAAAAVATVVVVAVVTTEAGSVTVRVETVPPDAEGTFLVTGVPFCPAVGPDGESISDQDLQDAIDEAGGTTQDLAWDPYPPCVPAGGEFTEGGLEEGTYSTTMSDPAPEFVVDEVTCDDEDSPLPSSGDAGSRTAIFNVDLNEHVTCTYTLARTGTAIVHMRTEPEGSAGRFAFSGNPSCPMSDTGVVECLPANARYVVSDLVPGTYTSTEVDPAPEFDVTDVSCDDEDSPTPSSGDAGSRTAVYNIDPGETVTCTFVNTRRGSAIAAVAIESGDTGARFGYTGVPGCELPGEDEEFVPCIEGPGSVVAIDLQPGTYTSTLVDPGPEFEVVAAECDDASSRTPSAADPTTRTAVFNIDPGETVTCTLTVAEPDSSGDPRGTFGGSGYNPYDPAADPELDPDRELIPDRETFEDLPPGVPDDLAPDAGTYLVPKEGTWEATNQAVVMSCAGLTVPLERHTELGTIEVFDDGTRIVGTGLTEDGAPIELHSVDSINGRYEGSIVIPEGGDLRFLMQLETDELIWGVLDGELATGDAPCEILRPVVLVYLGP